jgi:hypothetical protein
MGYNHTSSTFSSQDAWTFRWVVGTADVPVAAVATILLMLVHRSFTST